MRFPFGIPVFSFQYFVTRSYTQRWNYATSIILFFCVITFGGLCALNVFLVGYDVVTEVSSNFIASQKLPWTLSWNSTASGCQEHSFQLGDTIRTNISAFPYSIFDINSTGSQGDFLYANNRLDACDVSTIQIIVSPGDRSVSAQASVNCSQLGFQASTSWSYTNHPIVGSVSPSVFSENSLARAILDTMNGFGDDAYGPIYNTQYVVVNGSSPNQLYKVTVQFEPQCTSSDCDHESPNITIAWYNGILQSSLAIVANTNNYAHVVQASTDTLQNFAQVFYAAVRMDIGHWTPNNILTNVTSFNHSISSNAPYAESALVLSVPLAYVNMTSIPSADTATPPAVIQTQYICSTSKLKTPGSLFMSVASATLSIFLFAWGLLAVVVGMLPRKKPEDTVTGEYSARGSILSEHIRQESFRNENETDVSLNQISLLN